jgi:hypothetical protein
MRRRSWLVVCLVLGGLPAAAHAEGEMGNRGTKVVTGEFQLQVAQSGDDSDGSEKTTSIYVAPSLDLFVAPGLSLGGALVFSRSSSGDFSSLGVGIAPRLGYYVPVGSSLGLWVRGHAGYFYAKTDLGPLGGESTAKSLALRGDGFLLIHVARHFFIGGGLFLQTEVYAENDDGDLPKDTTYGLQTMIGGWW